MPTSTAGKTPNSRARQRGFTYAMVLVAIVLVGLFAGLANLTTTRIVQADREAELLFRGQAYRNAIARYHALAGRYPRTLQDLLQDPRLAQRTHLRALYPDPMAEPAERALEGGWRLLRARDGGIAGVASKSRQEPLKKAHFPPGLDKFEAARTYEEWLFEYALRLPGPIKPVSVAAVL